jgi:hypothetical protein
MVKLPAETGELLEELAAKLGLTITATIGRLLREKIASGLLDDHLPGWNVRPVGRSRHELTFGDFSFRLGPEDAANVADAIELVATAKGDRGKKMLDSESGKTLGVARLGKGVIVLGTNKDGQETKRSLTSDLALDLARLIRKAAPPRVKTSNKIATLGD